jgi:hypothetical protein
VNILFTNNTLKHRAGSELVVVELAEGLQRHGHRVAAYSTHVGEVGDLLRRMSIPVIRDPQACPFVPDLIHGQHHLDAMAALCAFASVPAIYHCHGYLPWVETPPKHPRIHRYVGMCELISERIRIELALPDTAVVTVPNWVDTRRFRVVREPAVVPRRALLFQRDCNPFSWHAQQLRLAFARAGIYLDLQLPAESSRSLEVVLPDYDIVLASGRSAIEAMACGCAVMPYHPTSCLDFVGPENFESMQAQNFAPRLHSAQICRRSVSACLARYNPESTAAVTARIRSHCSLDVAVQQLQSLYSETITIAASQTDRKDAWAEREMIALSHYLRSLKPLVREHELLKDRWDALHDHPVRQLVRVLRWLQRRLRRIFSSQ